MLVTNVCNPVLSSVDFLLANSFLFVLCSCRSLLSLLVRFAIFATILFFLVVTLCASTAAAAEADFASAALSSASACFAACIGLSLCGESTL
jgi:hypothetical protein